MKVPFKYLGLPLGGNPRKSEFWEPVVEKIKRRLSNWKGKHLSSAGRLCLVKSVLSAIPLFYLSFFKIPNSVVNELVKIQRKFFWGGGDEERKIAWISWNQICERKEEGGLGVKDLLVFNKALLGKWRWRLGMDEEGLWKEVLESKYGCWRSLRNGGVSSKESWWWKDLRKATNEGDWFDKNVIWDVGRGGRIKFWKDVWLGDSPLHIKYPRIFSNVLSKDQLIGEAGYWNETIWVWNWAWRRQWFAWEVPLVKKFMEELGGCSVLRDREDVWVWKNSCEKVYSVSLAYERILRKGSGEPLEEFSKLWNSKALPSATCFAWRLLNSRIATKDNLLRRGILIENDVCVLCGEEETESVSHLFFSCSVVRCVWYSCFRWLGFQGVLHNLPVPNFMQFWIPGLNRKQNEAAVSIWIAIIWSIWGQRNKIIFSGCVADGLEIFTVAQVKAWGWVSKKYAPPACSYSDWCLDPISCLKLVN